GWGLSVIASAALMRTVITQGDWLTTIGCGVYAASLVALYATSTLSHSIAHPPRRSLFRMLDQICIFLLISGSYTPFLMAHSRTVAGWTLLAVMWALTFVGVAVRLRTGDQPVAVAWYVALAWLPVLILGQVHSLTGLTGLTYVIAGGLAYVIGLWFFVNDHKHPYFHALWHCCVIVGTGLHFLFHYRYVII
ncbi:MAG: hemolysin III family protein, partial [Planctomycetaceae bacterium]